MQQQLNVTILGAAGFIGNAMSEFLESRSYQIMRVDIQKPQNASGNWIVGDICDAATLDKATANADVVFHFASMANPSLNFSNPEIEFAENLDPFWDLVECCIKNGVSKIAFPSSGGTVYREQNEACTEETPLNPRTPYAICKVTTEYLLQYFSSNSTLETTIFRIANPYGPGQKPKPGQGVISHWLRAIQNDQPLTVFGDLESSRDFIYIDDACQLMEIACQTPFRSEIFNIGTGQAISLRQIHETISKIFGKPIKTNERESRFIDRTSIALEPKKILKHFPEFKFTDFETGLRNTLSNWQSN